MTEKNFERASAFVFLDDIRETFKRIFSKNEIKTAAAYSLQSTFEATLKSQMTHYNSNKEDIDNVLKLKKGVISFSEEIIQANGMNINLNI